MSTEGTCGFDHGGMRATHLFAWSSTLLAGRTLLGSAMNKGVVAVLHVNGN
jgi:hypothetical protein